MAARKATAADLAEIASGKGSKRDRAEAGVGGPGKRRLPLAKRLRRRKR